MLPNDHALVKAFTWFHKKDPAILQFIHAVGRPRSGLHGHQRTVDPARYHPFPRPKFQESMGRNGLPLG